MFRFLVASFTFALASGAPTAEAEADPQFLGGSYGGVPVAPPSNCVTEEEIFVTQVCTPRAEDVCSKETIITEEIKYEKVCKDVLNVLCDAPPAAASPYHNGGYVKRSAEAEPEADPQYGYGYGYGQGPAHAVAHPVTATVKHACREVVNQHCVDNPNVLPVPVEVEHCHTVTKVDCLPVENKIPKTTCQPVETQHSGYYGRGGYLGENEARIE